MSSVPSRHLNLMNLTTGQIFTKDFTNDHECEVFKNKVKRGTKLLIVADYKDLGYEN